HLFNHHLTRKERVPIHATYDRRARYEEHSDYQEHYIPPSPEPHHIWHSPGVRLGTSRGACRARKSTTAALNTAAAWIFTACPALAPTTWSPGMARSAKARSGKKRLSRSPQTRSVGTRRSLTRSRTGTLGVA